MAPLNVPLTRTALVKKAPGQAVITTQPMPVLKPGYMLIQTKAVALNPADAGDIDYDIDTSSPSTTKLSVGQRRYEGCVIGLDYAGIVMSIEPKSPAGNANFTHSKSFSPGDRVCGSAYGCNALSPDEGGFADYIVVSTNLQMHIPEYMSFEDAASLGVGILSAGMGLFQVSKLGIPPQIWNAVSDDSHHSKSDIDNRSHKEWILVYGGSTATGSIIIQFAKLYATFFPISLSTHTELYLGLDTVL
jgi:NADPH:quinone reductase-like Zn-dependent oxidoreductase